MLATLPPPSPPDLLITVHNHVLQDKHCPAPFPTYPRPTPASTHPLPHTHKNTCTGLCNPRPKAKVCGRGLKRADLDVALWNFTKHHWISSPNLNGFVTKPHWISSQNLTGFRYKTSLDFVTKPHWISSPNLTGFRHQTSLDFVTKPHWISSPNLIGFRHKTSLDFVTKPHWISSPNLTGFPHQNSLDFVTKPHWISSQNLTGFRHKTSLDFPLHSFGKRQRAKFQALVYDISPPAEKCHNWLITPQVWKTCQLTDSFSMVPA